VAFSTLLDKRERTERAARFADMAMSHPNKGIKKYLEGLAKG